MNEKLSWNNGHATMIEVPILLSGAQLSELLGVSERTVEGWRRKGEGPKYVRLGGKVVRYRAADLVAWLAAAESQTPAA